MVFVRSFNLANCRIFYNIIMEENMYGKEKNNTMKKIVCLLFLLMGLAFTLNAQNMPNWAVGTWVDDGHTITITATGRLSDSDGYTFDNPRIDGNIITWSSGRVRVTRTDNPNQIKYAVQGEIWLEWTYTKVGASAPSPQSSTQQAPTTTNTPAPDTTTSQTVPEWARGSWRSGTLRITITTDRLVRDGFIYMFTHVDDAGEVWFREESIKNNMRVKNTDTTNRIQLFQSIGESRTNWIDFIMTKN